MVDFDWLNGLQLRVVHVREARSGVCMKGR